MSTRFILIQILRGYTGYWLELPQSTFSWGAACLVEPHEWDTARNKSQFVEALPPGMAIAKTQPFEAHVPDENLPLQSLVSEQRTRSFKHSQHFVKCKRVVDMHETCTKHRILHKNNNKTNWCLNVTSTMFLFGPVCIGHRYKRRNLCSVLFRK